MENPFEVIARRLSNIEDLLLDLKHKPSSLSPSSSFEVKELLNVTEAAELLSLTTATVYGMVYEKRIPFSKPGGRLYFSRAELLKWVKNGRKATAEELDEQARQQMASRVNRRVKSKAAKSGVRA